MWKLKAAAGRIFLAAGAALVALPVVAQGASPPAVDDLTRARKLYMACAACHNNDDTGQHTAGPNLKGVVGRPIGKAKGFAFSMALRNAKGRWTPERLDAFLKSPATEVPGTNMAFAGLSKDEDRAALVRYLQSTK